MAFLVPRLCTGCCLQPYCSVNNNCNNNANNCIGADSYIDILAHQQQQKYVTLPLPLVTLTFYSLGMHVPIKLTDTAEAFPRKGASNRMIMIRMRMSPLNLQEASRVRDHA